MIRFRCRCSHEFSVDEDQAGNPIQCPRCGLLNDVPLLSDLAGIADDGTYEIDESSAPKANPNQLAEFFDIYGKQRRGVPPDEIDRRTLPEEIELAPVPVPSATPRYDPETGERLDPLATREAAAEPLPAIPMAQPALTYLPTHGDFVRQLTPRAVLLELFMPANMVVWAIVLAFQIAAQLILAFPMAILLLARSFNGGPSIGWVLLLPITFLLIAHYGNVIHDMGPEGHDDLRRPLRDLHFGEDVFTPFAQMTFGLFVCYGPAVVASLLLGWMFGERPEFLALLALSAFASATAPAVLMTMTTDGTLQNLSPMRLAGVMLAGGSEYLLSAVLWHIGFTLAVVSLFGTAWWPAGWNSSKLAEALIHPLVAPTLAAISVYLLHAACWNIGLIYRYRHEKFPWVHQRHIATPRRVQRRRPKYVAQTPAPR